MMVRLAGLFVKDAAIAEEVVQETWLGVLRGLDRFEARSTLKRWISTIVINRAKARALRERRSIPFSAMWDATDTEVFEPAVGQVDVESPLPGQDLLVGSRLDQPTQGGTGLWTRIAQVGACRTGGRWQADDRCAV